MPKVEQEQSISGRIRVSLKRFSLALIAGLVSIQAEAAFITLNAADYANGTDVSHALPGATLSVEWGYQGEYAYSYSPVTVQDGLFASADPASPHDGPTFTSIWAGLPLQVGWAFRDDVSILRVDFDTPTNYFEVWGMAGSISMLIEAYDINGQRVGACATHDHPDVYYYPPGVYDGCWSHYGTTTLDSGGQRILASLSIISETADIAFIRAATSYGGSANFQQITYNNVAVPVPATLGLFGLGLLGVAISRRGVKQLRD
jgi:hypothetical protein